MPGCLIIGALGVIGYWLWGIAFWDGIPRWVSVQQITSITGIVLPADCRVVRSRYRAGLRQKSLFAEFALPRNEMSTLTKAIARKMEMGDVSDLRWQTLSTFAPRWWPQYHELASAALFVQSLPSGPSRQICLADPRKTDGEAHVYLGWLEHQ